VIYTDRRMLRKRSLATNEEMLADSQHVLWFEEQKPRVRAKRDLPDFNDPLLKKEWFLVRQ
jgi:hypothetical protein